MIEKSRNEVRELLDKIRAKDNFTYEWGEYERYDGLKRKADEFLLLREEKK